MDPDSTYQVMLEAISEDQFDIAADSASSLLKWLRGGGFPPTVSIVGGGDVLELNHEQNNRAASYAVANEILYRANQALESR